MNRFNVFLCIPPDYDHNFPPLGTPALCAFLKHNGIHASQEDLNLQYRDFLLDHVKDISRLLPGKRRVFEPLLKKFFANRLKDRYYSHLLPGNADGVSSDLPYDNNTNSSFFFAERLLSNPLLWRYLQDEKENTYLQFYRKIDIVGSLDQEKTGLLGISITSPSQVIASLTLGLLVKKNIPSVHVVIGGQWPTLYRRELMHRRDLFGCFDSIIVFEGETPLLRLSQALKAKNPIAIPNVITKDGKDDFSLTRTEEDLNTLPAPDLDGLPLSQYDGIEEFKVFATTFETSRGCYWSKCAFCVDLPLPKPTYRCKDPRLVVRDMKILKEKYGIGMLMFSDPGLSARQMLDISREIKEKKLKIGWWTMARLDPGFNRKIFKSAAAAGLKQVNFGFESACDRIGRLLDKGNSQEVSSRLIKECASSGIEVGLQTMLGLPQETWEEGLATVDFLMRHRSFVSIATLNVFYVTPANHIYETPKKYGLEIKVDPALPFQFFHAFNNPKGLTSQEAKLLQHLYFSLLSGPYLDPEGSKRSSSSRKKLSMARGVKTGTVEFSLNGESLKAFYLVRPDSKEYILHDELCGWILKEIKKNRGLNEIYSSFAKRCFSLEAADAIFYGFIEEATQSGFLVNSHRRTRHAR